MVRAIVWGENVHEREEPRVAALYPDGMHSCIAGALEEDREIRAGTATLDQPEHGLCESTLDECEVLYWWGHAAHDRVEDAIVDRVHRRVLEGMGLVALHSAHYSKIFRRLLGTSCSLTWREADERERLWNCAPGHRITRGIGRTIEIPQSEMYGEPFRIPPPDEQIFLSWFQGGEAFRSGCTWRRGNGRVFYFSPGHESYPIYHQEEIRLVLRNAAHWARQRSVDVDSCPRVDPLEDLG